MKYSMIIIPTNQLNVNKFGGYFNMELLKAISSEYTAVSGIVVGYAEEKVEPKELSLSIQVDRI